MKIFDKISKAYTQEKPFVAYRSPNDEVLKMMSQHTDDLFVFDNFDQSGYVFAPFDNKEQAYIIKNDDVCIENIKFKELPLNEVVFSEDNFAKEKHITLVKNVVDTIESSEISKIVVSRKETVELKDFNLVEIFEKLLHSYRNAYVYVWYHPKIGIWLGATPETLLKVEQKSFKTMSLAGTQAYRGDDNYVWGAKELQEQQMVSDFIKTSLENKVNQLKFSDVETVKAGKLLHLRTKVSGELNSKKDVGNLIDLLHPTPAVCGLPKEASKMFILKNEGYHRSFYTGYLGELNINDDTSLYVNLRCFKIVDKIAYIYVGGGITVDSIPENEWLETVVKSETIKRVLNF